MKVCNAREPMAARQGLRLRQRQTLLCDSSF